jgi:hypothetical protein
VRIEPNPPLGSGRDAHPDTAITCTAARKTQPGQFAPCGEGLTVGRDGSDPVPQDYGPRYPLTGGRLRLADVNIGNDLYLHLERDFHAAMSRD